MQWILLDLDNNLYAYTQCNEAGIAAVLDELKKRGAQSGALDRGRKHTKQYLKGTAAEHHRLLYIARALEEISGKSLPEEALRLHELFWNAYFSHMTLYPGVQEFIASAHAEGFKICLLTNLTTDIQYRKIVHLGLSGVLDLIITSEDAGAEKPAATIFEYAKERTGFSSAVLIDDDPDYLKGAPVAGIGAILLRDPSQWSEMLEQVKKEFEKMSHA